MKKLFLATLLCSLSLSVCAADYSVKPKVTELTQTPSRVLLVGNSFMYYNCGVNSYISGLSKSLGIKLSTTMATIGGAGLDWHLVKTYLRKDGLASYSTLNDGSNKLSFNKYPDGKVFEAVVLQDNSQGPIHPELSKFFKKYAAIHSKDIRETGADSAFGRKFCVDISGKLVPINKGPFYIYPSTPVLVATYCGVKVDPRTHVIDVFGKPIKGLYAAGEVSGGVHGQSFLAASAISKSFTMGYIAADELLKNKGK